MAKRARGSTTRPGQRAPLDRSATPRRPAPDRPATPPPATLTEAEEQRAAELEARIVAAERAAQPATPLERRRSRTPDGAPGVRTGTLATRAAAEYGYVVRDVRRIVVIGGSMVIALIVLWIVQQVTGFGPL